MRVVCVNMRVPSSDANSLADSVTGLPPATILGASELLSLPRALPRGGGGGAQKQN